ncbi:MAG TPA: pantetheine-phosphate adenylyltransferase [Firmicutes bacterium]|nr:pantetheine-phosphate adenylyltransferase [Bacillota bacterium]
MKNKAVYAGTFDPITNGHIDILKRAGTMFDEITIAVSESKHKKTVFSLTERVKMVKKTCKGINFVKVMSYKGLLVDFLKTVDRRVVIRGLRAVSDFEYELQLALINKRMGKNIEMIYMMPMEEFLYISSSAVKEIALHNGDAGKFVPDFVAKELNKKFKKKQ